MKQSFGGSHLNHKRKSRRPLDFQKTTHLVLRLRETLPNLFHPRDGRLRGRFLEAAHKYQIRVYDLVFNHTHVHASLLIPDRKAYLDFIRELTSKLVKYFSRKYLCKFREIFLNRPFTRIVPWGKAYENLKSYMRKNEKESGISQLKTESQPKSESPLSHEAPPKRRRSEEPEAQLHFEF
jgi:hypothetical protein